MAFFQNWRLRRRIRRAARLRSLLRAEHGARRSYTLEQVRSAAEASGLRQALLPWVFAIHCSPEEFAASGVSGDYGALRQQVETLCNAPNFAAAEGLSDNFAPALCGDVDRTGAGAHHGGWFGGDSDGSWFGGHGHHGDSGWSGGDGGGGDSGGGGGDA